MISSFQKYDVVETYCVNGIKVSVLEFQLPLCYQTLADETPERVPVCVKIVNNTKINKPQWDYESDIVKNKDKLLLFLQGGPGFPTAFCSGAGDPPFLKPLLDRGFTVVLLDQRGTGLSCAIDADLLLSKGTVHEQFEFIKNFRADSIVRDSEIIRHSLIGHSKWTLLGQSFGGFTSVTYLSLFPNSLKQVLLTGGLPPILINDVKDVYDATIKHTEDRCIAFYKKFPQDIERVWDIIDHLNSNDVKLPNGGKLSANRFRHLGLRFGGSGGTFSLHRIVTSLWTDIKQRKNISYATKKSVQDSLGFETNVLYFLFQEAIYCNGKGISSKWAAQRALKEEWLHTDRSKGKFMFTGEMAFENMLDDYIELGKLKELAHYIHSYDQWGILYNIEALKSLALKEIPIVALVYLDDQYVDYELAKRNKDLFAYTPYITNGLFHNGLTASSEEVLNKLFGLLENGEYM